MAYRWTLQLTLAGPCGERHAVGIDLDTEIIRDINSMRPLNDFFPGEVSFEQAVEVIKRRVYRKDLFQDASGRLGAMLAERMEDKEGWHGEERKERLKARGEDGHGR